MVYVSNINDYLSKYFDEYNPIRVEDLELISSIGLDYLLWDELTTYIYNNIDKDVELYALLSDLHLNGKGVELDKAKSLELLDEGVRQGSLYCITKKANKEIDRALLDFDYDEAIRLIKLASKQNFLPALNVEAWMYIKGAGYDRDYNKGLELYKKLNDAGYLPGCYNYGRSILEDDFEEAVKCLEYSGDNGYDKSFALLGLVHYQNCEYDYAFKYFNKATLSNNATAYRYIANMYQYGEFLDQDNSMAEYYYKLAIKFGDDSAKQELANLYEE